MVSHGDTPISCPATTSSVECRGENRLASRRCVTKGRDFHVRDGDKLEAAAEQRELRRMSRPSSFASLAPHFVAGDASPSAELAARLAALDRRAADLDAFVAVAREAATAAAAAADQRWRDNRPLSPIDGMAIGIKDIIETEDMPTGQGSPLWTGTHTKRDAACVQALREAGAVILAKTTTTEYAGSEP